MSVDATTMQRLAIVRYMYQKAIEESRQPDPLAFASIMTFHDSVEFFLQVAADKYGVPGPRPGRTLEFMAYFPELAKLQPPVVLKHKGGMQKLNDLRNDLKHAFKLPHPLTLDGLRGNVTDFFEENTPLVFGITFASVSMLNLVRYDVAKVRLEEASDALTNGDTLLGMDKIAIAFAEMLREFEHGLRKQWKRSPSQFWFQSSLEHYKGRVGGFSGTDREVQLGLQRGIERDNALIDSVLQLQEPMRIISLGLDYRRYVKFMILTPRPKAFGDSPDRGYQVTASPDRTPPSADECRFCMGFVIESAIRLMDYEAFLVT